MSKGTRLWMVYEIGVKTVCGEVANKAVRLDDIIWPTDCRAKVCDIMFRVASACLVLSLENNIF